MTDLYLSRAEVQGKHRGSWAEMAACCWLLQQGYEVFRNVSAHGAVDVIGMKNGEVTKFDVKSAGCFNGTGFRVTEEQKALGVKLLVVVDDGSVIVIDEPVCKPEPKVCAHCSETFTPYRNWNVYCSNRCRAAHTKRREMMACRICEKPFTPTHASQRICSQTCKREAQMAAKARMKAGLTPGRAKGMLIGGPLMPSKAKPMSGQPETAPAHTAPLQTPANAIPEATP